MDSSYEAVRRELVENGPMTPTVLAGIVGIDVSVVSRLLARLVREDLVRRTRRGKEVHFAPRRHLRTEFSGPLAPGTGEGPPAWAYWVWESGQPLDWRFPLTSRIPDGDGQRTMNRFLARCLEHGLLTPWLTEKPTPAKSRRHAAQSPHSRAASLHNPRPWQGLEVIAYGSCARGEARPESDLDVFVLGPPVDWAGVEPDGHLERRAWLSWKQALQRQAAEISVGAPRHVDLMFGAAGAPSDPLPLRDADETGGLYLHPEGLVNELVDHGITTYSATGTGFTVEARRRTVGR